MNKDNIPFGGADLADYLGRCGRSLAEELGSPLRQRPLASARFCSCPEWASDEKKVVLC
jgi:hypothetical protein